MKDPKELEDNAYNVHDMNNLALVHRECNDSKNSIVPDDKYIDKLSIPDEKKEWLKNKLKEDKVIIDNYINIIEETLRKQDNRCSRCGAPIYSVESGVIRRIDWDLPRNKDNCMIVCSRCNKKYV